MLFSTATLNRFLLTVAAVYILPVVLLSVGMIPSRLRFVVLILLAVAAGVLAHLRHYSFLDLGLGSVPVRSLVLWTAIPSLILVGGIVMAKLTYRYIPSEGWIFYLFFVFLSSPAQEFLFRSFLFAECSAAGLSKIFTIFVTAALYSFMHILYRDSRTVILTFVVGLIWGTVYAQTQSLVVVAASHAVVGVIAIFLGVI